MTKVFIRLLILSLMALFTRVVFADLVDVLPSSRTVQTVVRPTRHLFRTVQYRNLHRTQMETVTSARNFQMPKQVTRSMARRQNFVASQRPLIRRKNQTVIKMRGTALSMDELMNGTRR